MKSKRHMKILEIIEKRDIETQDELAEALREEGFEVTQATVSRDIKKLRLIKMQDENRKYIYKAPETKTINISDNLSTILSNFTLSIEKVDKFIVVKTISAGAAPVAEAIDSLDISDIAGTIAGDNTIFILMRSDEGAEELIGIINKFIS